MLKCSTCTKLEYEVQAADTVQLASKCRDCCNSDQLYDIAVIEGDRKYIRQFYPNVQSILVDKLLSKFVKFRYNKAATKPSMLLFNNVDPISLKTMKSNEKKDIKLDLGVDNSPVDTVNIANWDVDAIKEYLLVNIK